MAVKKRKDVYWLDVTIKGNRVRQSLHTTDKVKATELHDKLKAKMWDSAYLDKKAVYTWEEAVANWRIEKKDKKSLHKDEVIISYLSTFFAGKELKDLDFDEALNEKGRHVTGVTLNRYKAFIRSLFRSAKFLWKWDVEIPHFSFARERPRDRFLTPTEFERLISNLPDNLKSVVAFGVVTGLRRSNILDVSRKCVDVINKTLTLGPQHTKNGKPLTLPLSDKALEILRQVDYKFKLSSNSYQIFKRCARQAGLGNIRFHDLRHTYASWAAQRGVPIEVLSRLLGHSDLKTTDRYRHLNTSDLRKYI